MQRVANNWVNVIMAPSLGTGKYLQIRQKVYHSYSGRSQGTFQDKNVENYLPSYGVPEI